MKTGTPVLNTVCFAHNSCVFLQGLLASLANLILVLYLFDWFTSDLWPYWKNPVVHQYCNTESKTENLIHNRPAVYTKLLCCLCPRIFADLYGLIHICHLNDILVKFMYTLNVLWYLTAKYKVLLSIFFIVISASGPWSTWYMVHILSACIIQSWGGLL